MNLLLKLMGLYGQTTVKKIQFSIFKNFVQKKRKMGINFGDFFKSL